jgi:hypothetical protein
MNKKVNEPEVTLRYSGAYFRQDSFRCEKISGAYAPVFEVTDEDRQQRSTSWSVFNADKTPAADLNSSEARCEERYCLPEQGYIVTEKGMKGLEFETKVFTFAVTGGKDGYTVEIAESRDAGLLDELRGKIVSDGVLIRDKFNESIINETLPHDIKKHSANYETGLRKALQALRDTNFLDIDPEDGTCQYFRMDSMDRDFSYEPRGCFERRESLQVQAPGGQFASYKEGCLEGLSPENMGMLLYKESNRAPVFKILKPAELLHDVSARKWLKTTVQYRYPQDAADIARAYPQLWRELFKTEEHWKEIGAMDEAPAPQRFGDAEMYVPAEYMEGHWGFKKGPFQLSIRDCGLNPDFGPGSDYLICAPKRNNTFAVSFISHDGGEYFAVYGIEGMKRFKKEPYAYLKFHRLIPLSEALNRGLDRGDDKPDLARLLFYAYHFHTQKDGLAAAPADDGTFSDLETLPEAGKELTVLGLLVRE